ncbi:DoxX family protein [Hyphobacterium sp. CCMP332]|nr:DoxX family protein [Hyphobacterium sp. CCMP332]
MIYILALISAASFLYYGLNCLLSFKMKEEFRRFGLDAQRQLTGILQLLGAMGLLVGVFLSAGIGALAAAGLSLLMLFGFAVRLKVRDGLLASLPSFIFMLLNAYLSYGFYLLL